MTQIDYDNVTVSLGDYLTEIGMQLSNFSTRKWHDNFKESRKIEEMPTFYVSDRNGKNKCFSFIIL